MIPPVLIETMQRSLFVLPLLTLSALSDAAVCPRFRTLRNAACTLLEASKGLVSLRATSRLAPSVPCFFHGWLFHNISFPLRFDEYSNKVAIPPGNSLFALSLPFQLHVL